jgi:hypothetical protein
MARLVGLVLVGASGLAPLWGLTCNLLAAGQEVVLLLGGLAGLKKRDRQRQGG